MTACPAAGTHCARSRRSRHRSRPALPRCANWDACRGQGRRARGIAHNGRRTSAPLPRWLEVVRYRDLLSSCRFPRRGSPRSCQSQGFAQPGTTTGRQARSANLSSLRVVAPFAMKTAKYLLKFIGNIESPDHAQTIGIKAEISSEGNIRAVWNVKSYRWT